LANQVTAVSPLGQLVAELQALFTQHGAAANIAYATAIQVISGLVRRQATILAMQDSFRLSVVLTGVGIIASCFMRYCRAVPVTPTERPLSKQEQQEREAAREEAMLAV
jgi:hypothetical protein